MDLDGSSKRLTGGGAVDRRSFLVGGSAAGVAAVGLVTRENQWLERVRSDPLGHASVGYLLGSDRTRGLARLPRHADPHETPLVSDARRVVPLRYLVSRGSDLSASLWVWVHGLFPSKCAGAVQLSSVSLDAIVPHDHSATTVHLWTFRNEGVVESSPGTRLRVPFGDGLRLRLSVRPPDAPATSRDAVLGGGGGVRRGTYLIGLAPRTWESLAVLRGSLDQRCDLASIAVSVDRAS